MHQRNGIFISYRRADSAGWATVIFEQVKQVLYETPVFMDIDAIAPGQDFVDAINDSLERAKVLLVLVGNKWLKDSSGKDVLANPDDFIRLEVEQALKQKIPLIPVLVDGASMPQRQDLPESLYPMLRRQAITIHNETYRADINRLINSIRRLFNEPDKAANLLPEEEESPLPVNEPVPVSNKSATTHKSWWTYAWLLLLIPVGYLLSQFIPGGDPNPIPPYPTTIPLSENTFLEIQLLDFHSEEQPELLRVYAESFLPEFHDRCRELLLPEREAGWEGIVRLSWVIRALEDPEATLYRNEDIRILETNIDRPQALECLMQTIRQRRDQGIQQDFDIPVEVSYRFAVLVE